MARESTKRQEARRWVAALGLAVRHLRRERGWSQERLAAAAAKVSVGSLGGFERGERNPTLAVLMRLAEALEVRPSLPFDLAERICDGELDVQEDG